MEAGPTLEEPELVSLLANDGDQEFRDRNIGLPFNPEMVKKARARNAIRGGVEGS